MKNFDNARALLQRGIRHNQESQMLWHEVHILKAALKHDFKMVRYSDVKYSLHIYSGR